MSNKFKTINHRRTTWEFETRRYHLGAGAKFTLEAAETVSNEPFTSVSFHSNHPKKMNRDELMTLAHMLQEVAMNMADPDV